MQKLLKNKIKVIPVILLMAGFLFSCNNDLATIKRISFKSTDPDERTENLKVLYNDDGLAKVEVFAKIAETYNKPTHLVKLKDSIEIKFYDESGNLSSILTALYGEIRQAEGTMFVQDSVQLKNIYKNQVLSTEKLWWNQKDSSIFTNKLVTIKTPEALFYGKGVKTKQDFSSYEFIKPRGKVKLKNNGNL